MKAQNSEEDYGFSEMQVWLRRLGLLLLIPSLVYLPLAMFGSAPVDVLAVGGISGLKVVGSCAVFGCLISALGYWGT